MVSQELDNVIQSYDTNDAVYIHDNHDRPAEISNGNVRDEEVKIKKKRKKDMQIGKVSCWTHTVIIFVVTYFIQ